MKGAGHVTAAFREWIIRLWATLHPARSDRELQDELRLHLEFAVEKARSEGYTGSAAAKQAVLEVGGLAQSMESLRDQRSLPWLTDAGRDMRYGSRILANHPGFAAAAVVTLSLGIGATTAVFSAVNAVLIRPLPYGHPEQLVSVGVWNTKLEGIPVPAGVDVFPPSNADFSDLQRDAHSFSTLAEFSAVGFNASDGSLARFVGGARVTADFFATFEMSAEIGRVISATDVRGGARNAVISHQLWQSAFGGDAAVLERSLMLNGQTYSIIGVMPPSFTYPGAADLGPDAFAPSTDIWVPHSLTPDQAAERDFSNNSGAVGRLRAGSSLKDAQAETAALIARLDRLHSPNWHGWFAVVKPFGESSRRSARRPMLLLLAAVFLVLLIACSNTAHLLLARGASRKHEMLVRTWVGASRGRLIRQLIAESLVMALGGGLLGLLWAVAMIRLLPLIDPGGIPRLDEASLDWRVLGFATVLTGLTALAFGLLPAILVSGANADRQVGEDGNLRVTSHTQGVLQKLCGVQVGLAVTLLSSSLLFVRSYVNLQHIDRGFSASALTMRFNVNERYRRPEQRKALLQHFVESIRRLPGVQAAGAVNALPLSHAESLSTFEVEGFANTANQAVNTRWATGSYFDAMGTGLVEGRLLNDDDVDGRLRVVVVNQAFVNAFLRGPSPLGRRFRIRNFLSDAPTPWSIIVGVVADVRHSSVEEAAPPQVYASVFQSAGFDSFYVAVRPAGDSDSLASAIRRKIHDLDPVVAVADVQSMAERVSTAMALRRFQTTLLVLFGMVAVVLTAVGIGGATAYSLRQRRAEIGIRLALGARHRDLSLLILGQGLRATLIGATLGVAASLAMSRVLKSMLFGIAPEDPVVFTAVFVLLTAVALTAGYLPLRRTLKVDPLASLRSQ